MSDSVAYDGEYTDDVITIEGSRFAVSGPVRAQSITEFSTGLKIGSATYDEREHAFFTVFDDFSGGMGHRRLDLREAGGTHWDNVGGVDLRRARHVTLPPLHSTLNPTADPTDNWLASGLGTLLPVALAGPESSPIDLTVIGVGDALYSLDAGRTTLTRRKLCTAGAGGDWDLCRRVVSVVNSSGVEGVVACGWNTAAPPTSRFYFSTNGTTWTEGDRHLYDAIVFEDKFVVSGLDSSNKPCIFSTADPLAAVPSWDIDDATIGANVYTKGGVRYIGLAAGFWGDTAMWLLDAGKLYMHDWSAAKLYPVDDLGDNLLLGNGIVWNASIFVTDGFSVWEYIPASGESIRHVGPLGKDGAPPSFAESRYEIKQFISGTSHLWALCSNRSNHTAYRLMVYNGAGWSWIGPEVTSGGAAGAAPYGAVVDRFPIRYSITTYSRFVQVAAFDGQAADGSKTDFTLHLHQLPLQGEIPRVGIDSFEDGPLAFEVGWYGGGFDELEGVLLRMNIDGYNITADESVKVEYRLNNDESSTYETLGTFNANQQELWFSEDRRGVQFKTVMFRITLDRGSTATLSPELRSLVLVFDKKPDLRTAWHARVDLNRSVERGFYESLPEAWDALRAAWNTKRLLKFVVPSVAPQGLNVRVSEIISSFDAVRLEDTVNATAEVTFLETVT